MNIDNNAKEIIIMPTNNLFAKPTNCELLWDNPNSGHNDCYINILLSYKYNGFCTLC